MPGLSNIFKRKQHATFQCVSKRKGCNHFSFTVDQTQTSAARLCKYIFKNKVKSSGKNWAPSPMPASPLLKKEQHRGQHHLIFLAPGKLTMCHRLFPASEMGLEVFSE